MPSAPVIPHSQQASVDQVELSAAVSAFMSAGQDIRRENGLFRVKKLVRGGDRFLTDAEVILLARSLGKKNVAGAAEG